MRKLFFILVTTAIISSCSKTEKISLFNGKDLAGWDTYIGPAYDTARKKFDSIPVPASTTTPVASFLLYRLTAKRP